MPVGIIADDIIVTPGIAEIESIDIARGSAWRIRDRSSNNHIARHFIGVAVPYCDNVIKAKTRHLRLTVIKRDVATQNNVARTGINTVGAGIGCRAHGSEEFHRSVNGQRIVAVVVYGIDIGLKFYGIRPVDGHRWSIGVGNMNLRNINNFVAAGGLIKGDVTGTYRRTCKFRDTTGGPGATPVGGVAPTAVGTRTSLVLCHA